MLIIAAITFKKSFFVHVEKPTKCASTPLAFERQLDTYIFPLFCSLVYFRPNMVFLGQSVLSRSSNTYTHTNLNLFSPGASRQLKLKEMV